MLGEFKDHGTEVKINPDFYFILFYLFFFHFKTIPFKKFGVREI